MKHVIQLNIFFKTRTAYTDYGNTLRWVKVNMLSYCGTLNKSGLKKKKKKKNPVIKTTGILVCKGNIAFLYGISE